MLIKTVPPWLNVCLCCAMTFPPGRGSVWWERTLAEGKGVGSSDWHQDCNCLLRRSWTNCRNWHYQVTRNLYANTRIKSTALPVKPILLVISLVSRIRILPDGLASIPYYALKCKLAGIPFTQENLDDVETRKEFIWKLGVPETDFKCRLTSYSEEDERFSVDLRLIETSGELDLNELVLTKFRHRRNVEGIVANRDFELEDELVSCFKCIIRNQSFIFSLTPLSFLALP